MKVCFWIILHCVVQTTGRQVLVNRGAKTGTRNDARNGVKDANPTVHFIEKDIKTKKVNTAPSSTATPQKQEEKWVVDSIYYDQYQSDSPAAGGSTVPDFCPPVPDVVSDEACALNSCQSDTDCGDTDRCCFNGCMYTCLPEVKSAPVLDWKVEPRRSRSGISWLIDGATNTRSEAELCNTAPVGPDEDPLLCPHGYVCFVEDAEDKKKKKKDKKKDKKKEGGKQSTRGTCVKKADKGSLEEEEIALTSALEGRKFCTVDNVVLLEGAKIRLVDKHCRCKRGFLSCSRYKSSAEKDDSAKVKKTKKNKKKDDSKKSKRRKRKRNKNRKKKANASS